MRSGLGMLQLHSHTPPVSERASTTTGENPLTITQHRLAPAHVPPRPQTPPWSLETLGAPAAAFCVYGAPAPQGSKSFKGMRTNKGTGKQVAVMAESSKKVAPWRQDVTAIGVQATNDPAWEPLDGFLVADMVFSMPKGPSIPKWKWWHNTTPDLSKLARSTEDALSGVVWKDDARVIAYRRLEKVYVGSDDTDALRAPGVVIRVWQVPEWLVAEKKAAARLR
jgi:Holliday junction resolvase RusA-like endonuclease